MFKLTSVTFVFLSGAISLFAQTNNRVSTAIQFGLNASYFDDRIGEFGDGNRADYHNSVRTGTLFGFGLSFPLTEIVAVQTEINFSSRGGSFYSENSSVIAIGGNGDEGNLVKNYRLKYLELPLLLSVNLGYLFNDKMPSGKSHATFAAGIVPAFNTNSSIRYNVFKETGNTTGPLVDVDEDYVVKEIGNAKSPIVSGVINIGINFLIKNETPAFVNFRFSKTLGNVYSVDQLGGYNMATKMGTVTATFGLYMNQKT